MPESEQVDRSNAVRISVVIPLYKCSGSVQLLHELLTKTIDPLTKGKFEIIFVNDASPENDWEIVSSCAETDKRVIGINLSRNFGQHYAITAGLDYVTGDWIVIMDGDLQDRPEEIKKLYNKAQTGFDVVVGKRTKRQDTFSKRLTSKIFYMVFNYLTDQDIDNRVANFGIYSKQVIDSVKKYKEKDRSVGLLISLVGFKRAEIDINHSSRSTGTSGYNFSKRLNLALDHILSHSNKPLFLSVKGGFILSFLSAIYVVWLILKYFLWGNIANGWTSLMVSLFFLSGVMVSVIGMVGLYVGKTYDEVKNRPLFIVKDVIGQRNKEDCK